MLGNVFHPLLITIMLFILQVRLSFDILYGNDFGYLFMHTSVTMLLFSVIQYLYRLRHKRRHLNDTLKALYWSRVSKDSVEN